MAEPITREEQYLAYLNGENDAIPKPITRVERYLYELCVNGGMGGGGGTSQSTLAWKPTVDADGNISWALSDNTIAPATQNIKGATGPAGYTPVKGTDYYTEADKQEMADLVLAALPTWEGGSY